MGAGNSAWTQEWTFTQQARGYSKDRCWGMDQIRQWISETSHYLQGGM